MQGDGFEGKERGTVGDDEEKMRMESGAVFVGSSILPGCNESLRDRNFAKDTRGAFRSDYRA